MALLIDGYNLLHVTGIFGSGRGPGGLHRSRQALLRFLSSAIDDAERPRTTIVFDAAEAPPGLPRTVAHDEMTVHFAANYEDADAMIEELIERADAPRSLLVVSSDHRIQRAARRRRCPYVDSDVWYAGQRQRCTDERLPAKSFKPSGPLSEQEVSYWLDEFEVDAAAQSESTEEEFRKPAADPSEASLNDSQGSDDRVASDADSLGPFPPGFADGLFDESN